MTRVASLRESKSSSVASLTLARCSSSAFPIVQSSEDASELIIHDIDTTMSKESLVLRPRDLAQVNSNDWPEFELKQAFVYDPEDPEKTPISLLHAGHYRPLTITGKLEPPNNQNFGSFIDNASHRAIAIELTNIKEFSYGEYGDGSLDIWAAGQAGWFTIRPSRSYRDMYNDMAQALKLLYFMADSYKALKRYSDLSAPFFFQKCSEEGLEGCNNVIDVAAMFTKHRYFLIASMLTNKEGLQWYRVPLYTWFQTTFQDDFALVQSRIKPPRPSKASSQKTSSQSPAPSTASSRRKKATAKQQSATPKSVATTRSGRSTRSTRSQSNATIDSLPIILDNTPELDQLPEVVSTPEHTKNHIDQSMSSSDNEMTSTGGKGKGKSALRPRPSKYVASRANKTNKDSPAAIQSKKVMTRPQPGDPDVMLVDSPPPEQEEASDKITEDTTEDSDDESMTGTPEATLPFRLQDSINNGDVWNCPVDGCMHRTYAASEPSSQLLIKAHNQTHDHDDDERVQLVRRMEAPYLPVNRLMNRVRGMAASKFPPPITQRY
ncbi:hypothetical protein E4T43_06293 [Aureobasidium subglaciale]|nr:hypothetical protein E4T43_06293 [Aureobasidium subglaciale]